MPTMRGRSQASGAATVASRATTSPAELREVIGNVTIDKVRDKVRCQECKSREWMRAQLFHPTGEQAHTIRYRRLVEIRWEKRVIWWDE